MHLDGFDLNLLVALNALLEEKSVSRAAERLFLSQPAMSGALQRLRERFNDQLLVRTGQRMELTTRAQSLIEPVREVIHLSQSMIATRQKFNPASMQRSFTILMSDVPAALLISRVIARVLAEAPDITLRLLPVMSYGDRYLDAGDADFSIRPEEGHLNPRLASHSLHKASLFKDRWACVIAADHPLVGDTLTVADYLQYPHLSMSFGEGVASIAELALREHEVQIRELVSVTRFSDLLFLLPGSTLIATIPRRLADRLHAHFPIRIFEPPFPIPELREMLFWHERNEADAGHVWLRQVILEAALTIE